MSRFGALDISELARTDLWQFAGRSAFHALHFCHSGLGLERSGRLHGFAAARHCGVFWNRRLHHGYFAGPVVSVSGAIHGRANFIGSRCWHLRTSPRRSNASVARRLFALVTLGFGEMVKVTLRNLEEITAGTKGLNPIPAPHSPQWFATAVGWFGIENSWETDYRLYYFLTLGILAVVVVLLEEPGALASRSILDCHSRR